MYKVIFLSFLLFSCSTTYQPPIPSELERFGYENCQGDEFTYINDSECILRTKKDDYKILKNIQISELSIRHSRAVKGRKFVNCDKGNRDLLEMSGPFNSFTSRSIEIIMSQVESCTKNDETGFKIIAMTSGGGTVKDGMKVGRLIRENNFSTFVPNGLCASSCAIAFLGGNNRKLSPMGELLLHAPYMTNQTTTDERILRQIFDIEDFGISCLKEMPELKEYFIEMIGEKNGEFLYEQTMDYCSTKNGWVFNKEGAELYGIEKSIEDPLEKYEETYK